MAADVTERGKRPLAPVAGPYGHPFHPLLVTVPIGAWVSSFVFDLASQRASDPYIYTRGSYWLIAIGLVGAVVAAGVGVLDLLQIPRGTPAFRTGVRHLLLNDVVIAILAVSFLLRMGDTGFFDGEVHLGLVALSAVALLILSVSGWLGGRMTYRYGVRVVDEETQSEGFAEDAPASTPAGGPAGGPRPGAGADPQP